MEGYQIVAPKKILFLTGTRADFGKLLPLIEYVDKSPEFECFIFATGMHMLHRYGFTLKEIEKKGFKNIFPYINQIGTINSQMDLTLATTIQGLGHYVRELLPDMIVVHGDRVETLAGAIVGSLNNILVAHIEGGEISGTIDELIRHAVSKLSHLHFVSNDDACRRLIQMGEEINSIYIIGSPDIDIMLSDKLPSFAELVKRYDIGFSDYAIFMYHPVTTELNHLENHIKTIIDALRASGWNFVVIYPNNDQGSEVIFDAFKNIENDSHFRLIPSLRFEYFLTLLKHAKAIIGNSSAGIREAPVYGIPTVNIGTRQMNRFDYPSIINVQEDKLDIINSLNNLPTFIAPSRYFGDGKSAEAFISALNGPKVWEVPRQKQFNDL
jgi:UDP-N-acetylglucosamine 2-epimerase (hydrolysing)